MRTSIDQTQYQCSELVKVLHEDRFGNTCETIGNLEEISSTYVTLLCDAMLEPGRPVPFSVKDRDMYGLISSSDFHPLLGWFTNVTLDPCSRWSGRMFVPEHFLALCASARKMPEVSRTTKVLSRDRTLGD